MNSRGFSIFQRKHLVTSRTFQLRNNDVKITIDRFGQLMITEDRFGRDDRYGKDDRGWMITMARIKETIMEEIIVTGNFK
jgi:hypothetical protein